MVKVQQLGLSPKGSWEVQTPQLPLQIASRHCNLHRAARLRPSWYTELQQERPGATQLGYVCLGKRSCPGLTWLIEMPTTHTC